MNQINNILNLIDKNILNFVYSISNVYFASDWLSVFFYFNPCLMPNLDFEEYIPLVVIYKQINSYVSAHMQTSKWPI